MIGAENIRFEPTPHLQGDPEKCAWLHAENPQVKLMIGVKPLKVDARQCPGCIFPDAPPGRWPHVKDTRCKLVRAVCQECKGMGNLVAENGYVTQCPECCGEGRFS
jgi:hypothetical protein